VDTVVSVVMNYKEFIVNVSRPYIVA